MLCGALANEADWVPVKQLISARMISELLKPGVVIEKFDDEFSGAKKAGLRQLSGFSFVSC